MSKKVTAGRDYLGDIAPQFAAINDDVLFGEVWSREGQLSPHDRSMITVSALMGAGILDQSFESHVQTAKNNGITKAEMIEIITQLAFYTGWPNAWAAFQYVIDIYKEDNTEEIMTNRFGEHQLLNDPEHFNGPVWLREIKPFGNDHYIADSVLFAPGVRNHWHIHSIEQTLFVIQGKGWYVEEGKEPRELLPGDVVHIPGGKKHWHGAAKDCWFEHIAMEDITGDQPIWLELDDFKG